MRKRLFLWLQHILPQHALTVLMGRIANIRQPWLKNSLITSFVKLYNVNMDEAISKDLNAYPTFNDFFIRRLKPGIRPIALAPDAIISPADGTVARIGTAENDRLLQAKGFYFDLEALLAGDQALAQTFHHGPFATIYLAPYDYHRVHMPFTGKLVKSIYVPGKLFSVNSTTSESIPELYSCNERLITIFETEIGYMAVILVGAMIVGSMQTVWMQKPIRASHKIIEQIPMNLEIKKGDELGYFKMGSTVIVLFSKDRVQWSAALGAKSLVEMGEMIGKAKLSS